MVQSVRSHGAGLHNQTFVHPKKIYKAKPRRGCLANRGFMTLNLGWPNPVQHVGSPATFKWIVDLRLSDFFGFPLNAIHKGSPIRGHPNFRKHVESRIRNKQTKHVLVYWRVAFPNLNLPFAKWCNRPATSSSVFL